MWIERQTSNFCRTSWRFYLCFYLCFNTNCCIVSFLLLVPLAEYFRKIKVLRSSVSSSFILKTLRLKHFSWLTYPTVFILNEVQHKYTTSELTVAFLPWIQHGRSTTYEPGLSSTYFGKRQRGRLIFFFLFLFGIAVVMYLAWENSETNRRNEQI